MANYFIKDIPPRKPAEGVELRSIHGERMTVGFFTIAQGSGIPEHAHPHEQIGMVLKGRLQLKIAGEKRALASRHGEVELGIVHKKFRERFKFFERCTKK